jgi:hypothetical protein
VGGNQPLALPIFEPAMGETIWTSDELPGAFEHCRYLLGDELLSFLTAGAEVRADEPRTRRTVRRLAATLDLLEHEDARLPVALVRTQSQGLPVAWRMRVANGGEIPAPKGATDVEVALTTVARDLYPVLLAPSDATVILGPGLQFPVADSSFSFGEVVGVMPGVHEASALLASTGLPQSDFVIASASIVVPVGAAATPAGILSAATRRLLHIEQPDADRYMDLVLEVLAELRAFASGEAARVRAYLGLSALSLDSGVRLELPQGTLRSPTKSERRYVPFALQAEAVLETTVVCQAFEPDADVTGSQRDGALDLDRKARDMCLAAAMAADGVPSSCPYVAWRVTDDFGEGGSAYRPLHPDRAPGRNGALGAAESQEFTEWARRVAAADLTHIEIAVERTLRALWGMELTESLIDAVIAWENLVGTRSETVYRVTAALSVLCEDEPEMRISARKRLTKAYDARSRLVHGDPAASDLPAQRTVAVATTLEALRRLIVSRQDLLALSSSEKRADRLLLGIGPSAGDVAP